MRSTARANVRRRLRLAVAGAVVVTALTAATAGASAAAPMDAAMGSRTSTPVPGFVLERGRYRPVAIPPRLAATAPQGIVPMGINDRGQIAGEYEGPDGAGHGFLLDHGRFTTFDAPGATITFAVGLNDRGQVVGFSTSDLTATSISGFLLERGRFTTINRRGSTFTALFGINDRGQIVGAAGTPPAPSPQPAATPPMGRMA